jgi:hypothetical protein
MKVFVAVVLVLVLLVFFLLYGLASGERRARFINTMNALKEAHYELQKYGSFTNYSRNFSVYPYTNRFVVAGTNYQCEFAIESEEFSKRGFLTITTNQVFVWIDKKHGLVPLTTPLTYPPGL